MTHAFLQAVARAYVALAPTGQACAAFLSDFTADAPWIKGMSVVGPDNRISCSTQPAAVGLDVSDRDYIFQARRTWAFVLSEYLLQRVGGQPAIMATYAAQGNDEHAEAVLVAPVDLRWVEHFARLIEGRKGATAFLLDGRGRILAGIPEGGAMERQSTSDHPLIRAAMAATSGTMTAAGFDGIQRIYAFNELPGTDARILVGIDERDALGRIDRDISFAYIQLAVLGILAMIMARFFGERFFIEPIRALTRTAVNIGRGELAARPRRDRWTPEFAPLAAALADMAERLAARENDLRAANHHLEELALLDALSGLPNRRSFDMRIASTWLATDAKSPISLVMVDVDHFKLFNDTQGHLEGDNCLRLIGKTLETALRKNDFAARYGGEEFVMLLPGVGAVEAREIAERSRRAIEMRSIPHHAAPSGFVSVSVGVATLTPEEAVNEQALIEAADAALYEAKRRGRNTIAVWAQAPLAAAC